MKKTENAIFTSSIGKINVNNLTVPEIEFKQ